MQRDDQRDKLLSEFSAMAAVGSVPEPWEKLFYDGTRYFLDARGQFIPMDQRSAVRHLKAAGLTTPECDQALNSIQVEHYVHFAGPIAGMNRGLHQVSGNKLLVTVSPRIIHSQPGTWPTLRATLDGLLGNDPDAGNRQVEIFLGWLKAARESLISGTYRPGQALVLAGPRNCGKSLLIDVIEQALGGRRANPYPSFSGRSNFNGDLVGAELLAVDDEAGSTDIRARRQLGANIKSGLFSGATRIEAKHRGGFVCRPFWRVVMACNDEPENLLVLPPLTEDIGDKITLLRCHRRPLPMISHTMEEKAAFFGQLMAELPAMLHAVESWKIPEDMAEERCRITHYHHPELLRALGELSPEAAMLALVDSLVDAGNLLLPWTGTAAELKAILLKEPTTSRDAERLLGWPLAAGTYLGRLEGNRVTKLSTRKGTQHWRVSPFPQEGGRVEQV